MSHYGDRWSYDVRRWLGIKLAEKDREIARLSAIVERYYEAQLAEIRKNGT